MTVFYIFLHLFWVMGLWAWIFLYMSALAEILLRFLCNDLLTSNFSKILAC